MKKDNFKANIMFVLAAVIWGLAFVAQDKASVFVPPFTLNAIRSFMGSAVLLPVIAFFSPKQKDAELKKKSRKELIIAGIICGSCLCVAVNLQQFGIALYPDNAATSGRSGFITALYVVIVPVLAIFRGQKSKLNIWLSVLIATVGMYMLCLGGGIGGLYLGDLIVLFCALAFAMQIHFVDKFVCTVDGIKLSSMQFFVCGILSGVLMLIFEKPDIAGITASIGAILYLGIMSSGIAYTLQVVGQKYSDNPTVAAVIMSLESVFAAIGGSVIMSERMSLREIAGCLIMFSAVILSQISPKSAKNSEN